MTITLYQASVPPFLQILRALRAVLGKARHQCDATKVQPEVLLQARLYPNMFPLVRQVQIAADFAKGAAARLAGLEPPRYEDTETTFEQLVERIDRTIAYLESIAPAQIDGQEARTVELKIGGQPQTFVGLPYLLHFALPNFYFHATTAYAILRHNGVDIGKGDFLGPRD